MLSEERYKIILDKIEKESVVYLTDLVELLNTSESTIRRDLNTLHKKGLLKKVHGGATSLEKIKINTIDDRVEYRQSLNMSQKVKIGKYAASLIEDSDLVYIDAGTTTEHMIDFIENTDAIFVTNGITHARKLIQKNCKTFILGGEIKLITEAIIGVEAINSLKKYNFTKSFLGTNGIDIKSGFTTPDIKEALVKEEALNKSKEVFILCDNSKFDKVSSITFSDIKNSKIKIITENLTNNIYKEIIEVLEVE